MSDSAPALLRRADELLVAMDYPGVEPLCTQAMARAKAQGDYALYARCLMPLQEARRHRRLLAAESGGLLLLTPPSTPQDAREQLATARRERAMVEVMHMPRPGVIASFDGPPVSVPVGEPGRDWAVWYLHAAERLGDAALASVTAPLGTAKRIDALEQALLVFTDHEILHQRLWDAARAMQRDKAHHPEPV